MIGVFAGRGDVLVGYFLAGLICLVLGWYLRKWYTGIAQWWADKRK